MSRVLFSRSDEALLLTIVLSGPAAEAAHGLLTPMRDLFAAMFFAFVGLAVDPASIPPVLLPATGLAVVTFFTKAATGWIGAARSGVGVRGATRAGLLLAARGEFSIAIAGPVLVRFADAVSAPLVRRSMAEAARRG